VDSFFDFDLLERVIEIIFVDIGLSGDNAIIIALASRSLPPPIRKIAVIFGSVASVLLRIFLTAIATFLLKIPLIKLISSIVLIYVAIKLVIDEQEEAEIESSDKLWNAVKVIVFADLFMSIENIVAVAAVADGSLGLLIFGLLVSMPLMFFGTNLVISALEKIPFLTWICGGLLGWVSGSVGSTDPFLIKWLGPDYVDFPIYAPFLGSIVVIMISKIILDNRNLDKKNRMA
jgi:hypothetical protein